MRRVNDAADGFTLIELLITITIIGILASLGLGALYKAQEQAREAKTKNTIYKLHVAMMHRWEGYRYRRLPISILPNERVFDLNDVDGYPNSMGFAWRQLNMRRALMRMELPQRWDEVTNPFLAFPYTPPLARTSLATAYFQYYTIRNNQTPITDANEDAECLYMIMSMGEDTSLVAEQLTHSEVGDTDGDGALEFLDAWGNPIHFLRWAPGFAAVNPWGSAIVNFVPVESALQAGIADPNAGGFFQEEHDPFDSRNVHKLAYALYPLIYSSGPDGVPDILHKVLDANGQPQNVGLNNLGNLDPYQLVPAPNNGPGESLIGQPFDRDLDGTLQHLDNIHNHIKSQR
ncbi:MAG: prepilin-type N-terminal cleavage/methylation domain-containing protein [Planctomycetes bacterium]|nr:prepilin-type N-terminal cleavage/methylation domain-containing protein [Planctomycetota bacterium]